MTGFPGKKVVGMAGVLDSARFQLFLAREAGVASRTCGRWCSAATATPWSRSLATARSTASRSSSCIAADKLDAIVERTRNGGGEIVKLMGTSAYYAPASAAVTMAVAYLHDEKRLVPCAAYLDGEYGYKDIYMGVPTVIGGEGVEKIVTIELTAEEKAMLDKSAAAVRELIELSKKL